MYARLPASLLGAAVVGCVLFGAPAALADNNLPGLMNPGSLGGVGLPQWLSGMQTDFVNMGTNLVVAAQRLFVVLLTIDVAWMTMQFLLTRDNLGEFLAQVALKVLTFSFVYYVLIQNGMAIATTIINSFLAAATQSYPLGNSSPPDVGGIISEGTTAATPAFIAGITFDAIPDEAFGTGMTNLMTAMGDFCMAGGTFILLGYFAIAGQLLIVTVEAYVVTTLGILVTGFYGSRWTQQYAEKYFGYAINCGVKLLVTYVVIGYIQNNLFDSVNESFAIGIPPLNFLEMGLGNWLLAFIAYSVPNFASSLVSGASTSSSDKLISSMQSAFQTATGEAKHKKSPERKEHGADGAKGSIAGSNAGAKDTASSQGRPPEVLYQAHPTVSHDDPHGLGLASKQNGAEGSTANGSAPPNGSGAISNGTTDGVTYLQPSNSVGSDAVAAKNASQGYDGSSSAEGSTRSAQEASSAGPSVSATGDPSNTPSAAGPPAASGSAQTSLHGGNGDGRSAIGAGSKQTALHGGHDDVFAKKPLGSGATSSAGAGNNEARTPAPLQADANNDKAANTQPIDNSAANPPAVGDGSTRQRALAGSSDGNTETRLDTLETKLQKQDSDIAALQNQPMPQAGPAPRRASAEVTHGESDE